MDPLDGDFLGRHRILGGEYMAVSAGADTPLHAVAFVDGNNAVARIKLRLALDLAAQLPHNVFLAFDG